MSHHRNIYHIKNTSQRTKRHIYHIKNTSQRTKRPLTHSERLILNFGHISQK